MIQILYTVVVGIAVAWIAAPAIPYIENRRVLRLAILALVGFIWFMWASPVGYHVGDRFIIVHRLTGKVALFCGSTLVRDNPELCPLGLQGFRPLTPDPHAFPSVTDALGLTKKP